MSESSSRVDFRTSLAAAAVLGFFSAAGDWVWARYIPDGAVIPGIVHGVLIFAILAVVLGRAAGRRGATARLLMTLPIAGLVIAAAFYPLAALLGYVGALLVTWCAMWMALAFLQRWVRGRRERSGRALVRALVAAIASGLAFWAISGIWTQPDPNPNYVLRFLYWTFAFLPGFAALVWRQEGGEA